MEKVSDSKVERHAVRGDLAGAKRGAASCQKIGRGVIHPSQGCIMIHVNNLTKYYGDYPAVQEVSFDVPAGQIVGFLGPNGAGKSTTMRILAGYITATSGSATIAGHDVFWDSVDVRRKIGYMPESCPLYKEMRINEYLHFRAGIKGIYGRLRRQRIDYVLER